MKSTNVLFLHKNLKFYEEIFMRCKKKYGKIWNIRHYLDDIWDWFQFQTRFDFFVIGDKPKNFTDSLFISFVPFSSSVFIFHGELFLRHRRKLKITSKLRPPCYSRTTFLLLRYISASARLWGHQHLHCGSEVGTGFLDVRCRESVSTKVTVAFGWLYLILGLPTA